MAASVLAQTDLLITVPSVSLSSVATSFGLERHELPFDLRPFGLSLFRNAALGDEPGTRWFIDQVAAAARALRDPE